MPKHSLMRLAITAVVIGAALGVTACGGSGHRSSSSTVSTSTASLPTPSTTASTPTTSSTSAGAQGSGPGPRRCRAAGLTLRFLGQQGATGRGELGFALHNTSSATCRTFGFPGILFLDRAGNALPTVAVRRTRDPFGSAPVASLMVAPGGSVSFRIGVTHGIASSAGCTTAYGLQVIPPDDTGAIRATIPGGAYECRQATVSPLRPGTSAYP